jgi:hypothetical protein
MNRRLTSLILALALSGCMGATDPTTTTTGTQPTDGATDDPSQPPAFGHGEGAVRGRVVDDEYLPVANASVTLLEHQRKVRTGADGRFLFNHVPTGTVTLIGEAAGHEPTAVRVPVREGATAETGLSLKRIPPENVPYHTALQPWVGYISCSVGFYSITTADFCGQGFSTVVPPIDPSNNTFRFTIHKGLSAIQTEVIWDQTNSLAAKRLALSFHSPPIGMVPGNVKPEDWWSTPCNADGGTPIVKRCFQVQNETKNPLWNKPETPAYGDIRAKGNNTNPNANTLTTWNWQNWTNGHAGPVIQQYFYGYFTLFYYGDPIPANYKARPDA